MCVCVIWHGGRLTGKCLYVYTTVCPARLWLLPVDWAVCFSSYIVVLLPSRIKDSFYANVAFTNTDQCYVQEMFT